MGKFLLSGIGCVLLILLLSGPRLKNTNVEAKVPIASAHSLDNRAVSTPNLALPAPTADDIRSAVARIYGDAVEVDKSTPYFVGDFNGDGSQDLAVEVRPLAAKLPDLNADLANWILEDPSQIFVPDPSKRVQSFPPKPPRQRILKAQPLLVIVHGYGPVGWRAPTARQSYLLANATGSSMALKAKGDEALAKTGRRPMPRLLGDVICEQRGLKRGFLFWTGGHYAWYQQ